MNHHIHPQFDKQIWLTPISILLGSLIIAWAISASGSPVKGTVASPASTASASGDLFKNIRPLQPTDHVRGNPKASVVLVEYSDTECPFCKTYHQTLSKYIASSTDVAWVYRHNPLAIHPKAQKEAEATECVAELGGEQKFWEYLDKIFAVTPSNNKLDESALPQIAASIGINERAFTDCLSSGRKAAKVAADKKEIEATGQFGTPYVVLMTKKGSTGIKGAVSYDKLEALVGAYLPK